MKKIFIALFLTLICLSFVFAVQGGDQDRLRDGTGENHEENVDNGGQGPNLISTQDDSEYEFEGKNANESRGAKLRAHNVEANCDCDLFEQSEGNKTRLKARLQNGAEREIKVMPDVASERALERLRLKVCLAEEGCSIELKEVGQENASRLAYELQAERHAKLLGLFQTKMQTRVQVDAENGEIIRVGKPWWAFLAYEPEEVSSEPENQTEVIETTSE